MEIATVHHVKEVIFHESAIALTAQEHASIDNQSRVICLEMVVFEGFDKVEMRIVAQ